MLPFRHWIVNDSDQPKAVGHRVRLLFVDTEDEPAGRKAAHSVAWVSKAWVNSVVSPRAVDFRGYNSR